MEPINLLPHCPDPHCNDVAALLATTALGGELSSEEQARTLHYVATCAQCRRRLDGFAKVAQGLLLSVPQSEPSPALRQRILAAAAQPPRPRPQQRQQQRARRDWRTATTGAFATFALLLALLAGQQYLGRQQQQQQTARNRAVVIAAFGNDDSREMQFVAGQNAPEAVGRVLVSPSHPAVVVYAKQLPLLAAGRIYQVWLQSDQQVISVGSFVPDANNRVWALLGPQATLPPPEAIFITEEPAPGSAQPGGPEMLRADFP